MSAADPADPWVIRTREQIGDRIRSFRRSSRITQDELCEAVGVDRKTISRWENGHHPMNVDDAARIARALAVPLAWLFGDDWAQPSIDATPPAPPDAP
jgi:transcriptional regulator with XRE-family HTH domain